MELREPCKSYGNYLQKTPDILSTLNPFVAIALTSKKGITLFPFSDILKPVHGCFFRRIFLGHRLIFLEFTLCRKIPFMWCNPSELVFEQVSTNTKNRVSFWALRVSFWTSLYEHEKSSLVLGPTFSRKIESRFLPYVSRFWNELSRQAATSLDFTFSIGLPET